MVEESERSLEARERLALVGRHRAEEVHKLHRALARKSRQVKRLREHLDEHKHLIKALYGTGLLAHLAAFGQATEHLKALHAHASGPNAASLLGTIGEAMSLVAGRTKALLETWQRFRAQYEAPEVLRPPPPSGSPISPAASEVPS